MQFPNREELDLQSLRRIRQARSQHVRMQLRCASTVDANGSSDRCVAPQRLITAIPHGRNLAAATFTNSSTLQNCALSNKRLRLRFSFRMRFVRSFSSAIKASRRMIKRSSSVSSLEAAGGASPCAMQTRARWRNVERHGFTPEPRADI